MKKTTIALTFIVLMLVPLRIFSLNGWFTMTYPEPIRPFESVFKAVCEVESNSNPLAYNPEENAVGIAQIRQIRVDDYNQRTGSNVQLDDCFNTEISKMIFMYYAERYGFGRIDDCIRSWNGSGSATYEYLKKVKQLI